MKSMMQEAASIMKAIEQAWEKAGKPRSFSVKIFEEAEHSFFGLSTKKNAKVGIFFNQADVHPSIHSSTSKTSTRTQDGRRNRKPAPKPQTRKREDKYSPLSARPEPVEGVEGHERRVTAQKKELWTAEMISSMEQNIKEQLALIGHGDKPFTLRANRYYLKCHFDTPVLAEANREKQLFRSWAHLLMQALRHKCKKQLRGFKLVLSSG